MDTQNTSNSNLSNKQSFISTRELRNGNEVSTIGPSTKPLDILDEIEDNNRNDTNQTTTPRQKINDQMPELTHLQQTGTFGPILETKTYSEDEKTVLLHFFTNINKNVYAATDAMPMALWALLEGGYSRSQVSMRERFLQIFKDMQKDFQKGKIQETDLITIKDFAESIRSNQGLDLSFFLTKAEKFMRKWAVQYGHDSLKDSDVLRFAIENITQFATGPIEEARLGAYQEKSTRYVPFAKDSLVVPTDLRQYETEIRAWNSLLMNSYEECEGIAQEFIKTTLNPQDFKSEAAMQRTINAKAFDIIRYFLPGTILTSLGVVWPTREAERHISKLMSDPREEIRSIGYALLEEGKKVSPGLLKHVQENEYQQKRSVNITNILNQINLDQEPRSIKRTDDCVKLISFDKDSELKIAAAILYEHNDKAHSYTHFLQILRQIPLLIKPIIEGYAKDKGKFDALPIATELGSMLFEVTMDYGGYRDLKRHRRNLLITSPLTALIGYEYPEYVKEKEALKDIKDKIDLCANATERLHKKIKQTHPHLASYIVMFVHKQQFIWQMDPRQLAYVVELRSTPAGHWSYRDIAQRMFKATQEHLPILSKFITVDMTDGTEGRKKQEEKTVEKLQALGAKNLQKVTF